MSTGISSNNLFKVARKPIPEKFMDAYLDALSLHLKLGTKETFIDLCEAKASILGFDPTFRGDAAVELGSPFLRDVLPVPPEATVPPPHGIVKQVEFLLTEGKGLTDWEVQFLNDLGQQVSKGYEPTPRQEAKFRQIWQERMPGDKGLGISG